jgi:hypothetical protein
MGPTYRHEPFPEYDTVPCLQFSEYSKAELTRLQEMVKAHAFPTTVEFQAADPLSANAWEVVISVTAETHGYPSEKEISIQPGQLVIWFADMIYVLSRYKTGAAQMDTYKYPGIQDIQVGDVL